MAGQREYINIVARRVFEDLRDRPVLLGGDGPAVEFNRTGWRHITRPGRPKLTRYQSFVLLGAARKVLESVPVAALKKHRSPTAPEMDFVSARAAVSFPFRQAAVVKIILSVREDRGIPRYVFHTIYEPRRRSGTAGTKGPGQALGVGSHGRIFNVLVLCDT